MNNLRSTILLAILLMASSFLWAQDLKSSNAHIGLIYPISTNGVHAKEYNNRFSLHGFAGVSGAERGFALAGFALIIKDSAMGLHASGFANFIGGSSHGVQLAGFLNQYGSSRGLSVAGFANISRDSSTVQLAGFINKAGDTHFQAAGFINIAKKVRGVQLAGFINIADSCRYPIGLLNFIRDGEQSIGVSTDETLTTLASFRSGSRKLYGILGVGYNGKTGKDLYAWEAGLGAHFQVVSAFRINAEGTTLGLSDFKDGVSFRQTFRILPALLIGDHIEIYAGPNFNFVNTKTGEGDGLIDHYAWSQRQSDGRLLGLYFGFTGGINIIL